MGRKRTRSSRVVLSDFVGFASADCGLFEILDGSPPRGVAPRPADKKLAIAPARNPMMMTQSKCIGASRIVTSLGRARVVEGKLRAGGSRTLVIADLTAAEDWNRAVG